jgi:SsrA-binding protein
MKILSTNKKARFDYEIVEEYSAGIKLEGREIKSLRSQKPAFAGSYVTISGGKPMLKDLTIPRFKHDASDDYNPKRERLLLLKKAEINRIEAKLKEQGVTLVPLAIGIERQWAKVTIGIVRGKKQHDKRQTIRDREDKRKMQRVMKQY